MKKVSISQALALLTRAANSLDAAGDYRAANQIDQQMVRISQLFGEEEAPPRRRGLGGHRQPGEAPPPFEAEPEPAPFADFGERRHEMEPRILREVEQEGMRMPPPDLMGPPGGQRIVDFEDLEDEPEGDLDPNQPPPQPPDVRVNINDQEVIVPAMAIGQKLHGMYTEDEWRGMPEPQRKAQIRLIVENLSQEMAGQGGGEGWGGGGDDEL